MSKKHTSVSTFVSECIRTSRAGIVWSVWLVWYQRLRKGVLL